MAPHRVQRMAEVGQHRRPTVPVRALPEGLLAVVGEQPGQRCQREMGVQLLAHQPLAAAPELLHDEHGFADLVVLFEAPAAMIEPGEVRPPVEGGVEQGGREREDGLADGVLDQPHPQRTPVGRGLLAAGVSGRCERHERLVAVRLNEGIERRVGVALQAEHGVQAALGVGVQQGEGVVAAVIDDDVAGGEGVEMQPGGTALVRVGVQAEVDRQAGVQPVQATEQALRVVGRRGRVCGNRT